MSAAVPFLDLRAAASELADELDAAARRVLASGWYLLGPELEAFEQEWATYNGVAHAVGVGSGLDALTLTLRALDVGPGDEVIVPSHTFIATWLAVSSVGATVVPVEPDESTFVVSAEAVGAAIGPRTAAIVPVHLYGRPVDVAGICEVAGRAGVPVLFDAAQAHGASAAGRPIGSWGTASAFSFYPAKNLGALSDGGAVTTNDAALAARLRRLRSYGSDQKYVHVERGANSRLDELQAAMLRVKLARLDEWNARRRAVARRYHEALAATSIVLPRMNLAEESAWHLYVVRTAGRDDLQRSLRDAGVETLVHYPIPPHRQQAYADTPLSRVSLPVADRLASEVLSLPIGPHLSDAHVEAVITPLRSGPRK
jgi:dTDP-3-amino-3,4,6-trideoxy-alpha-D-glucose transaminase